MHHPFRWRVTVTFVLLLIGRPAWSQMVQGVVVDAASGAPVARTSLSLLTSDGSIASRQITDEAGRFAILTPGPGSYRLRATRIGYAPFTTDTFALDQGQLAVAELRLQLNPIVLDPIDVVEESQKRNLVRGGFYTRQAKGWGQFRTPQDLELIRPVFHEDLFYGMTGVRIRSDGQVMGFRSYTGRCVLSIFIDGVATDSLPFTEMLHVNDIEALEVYSGTFGVPIWVGRPDPCGTVLIWTKGATR